MQVNNAFSDSLIRAAHLMGESLLNGTQYNEACLDKLVNNSSCYIFWKDSNSRFLACNREFATLSALSDPAMIIGKSDYELEWLDEECENYRSDDNQVIITSKPKIAIEETLTKKTEINRVTFLTSKFPIYSKSTHKAGLVGIAADITALKLFERYYFEINSNLDVNKSISNNLICEGLEETINKLMRIQGYLKKNTTAKCLFLYKRKQIGLTKRQVEYIAELLQGRDAKLMARSLGVETSTVYEQLENIRALFNCPSTSHLIEAILSSDIVIDHAANGKR